MNMKVRILTTVAWGKRMVVIDFGNVAVSVDENGTVARYLDGKPEVATKWEETGPEIKLFIPREEETEGLKKRIICGELVIENLNNAKVGRVVEIEFPEYRIFERAKEAPT
jgi:hypothetical protein